MGRRRRGKKVWQELTPVSASDRWSLVEIPLTTQLYILPAGASFEHEDDFAGAPILEYIGNHEVYLRGLRFRDNHGRFDRELFKRIEYWLRGKGIKRIRYRHKGRDIEL